VTKDGLFQLGHRKDDRADLPQMKAMMFVLAPLGVPGAPDALPGPRADAPLSILATTCVQERVGRCGLLSVVDGQMGALETQASLQAGGDGDLCPLAETQLPPAVL
jgi:transposase